MWKAKTKTGFRISTGGLPLLISTAALVHHVMITPALFCALEVETWYFWSCRDTADSLLHRARNEGLRVCSLLTGGRHKIGCRLSLLLVGTTRSLARAVRTVRS